MLRGPGDTGVPLHDPAGARVDGDEVRLEVGRHERDDASACHRRPEAAPVVPPATSGAAAATRNSRRFMHMTTAAAAARSVGPRAALDPYPGAWTSRWPDPSYSRQGMATRWRDERALVRGAQGGSDAALEELFRPHWPRAHQAAYLVVHDARRPRTSRRRRSSPRSGTSTASIAAGRSRRGCTASSSTGRSTTPAPGPCAQRQTSSRRSQHRQPHPTAPEESLLAEIGRLPPEQRAVIVLRYLLDYTPGEIATMLNVPRGTVNSRLRRGLDEMQAVHREA